MFYEFNQNNSGGSFDFDEEEGITHWVIVEADNYSAAISKAEDIGLYWNGCDTGMDSPWCGDRWYEPFDEKGTEKPEIYGEDISSKSFESGKLGTWMDEGKEACVHYKDGRKEWF